MATANGVRLDLTSQTAMNWKSGSVKRAEFMQCYLTIDPAAVIEGLAGDIVTDMAAIRSDSTGRRSSGRPLVMSRLKRTPSIACKLNPIIGMTADRIFRQRTRKTLSAIRRDLPFRVRDSQAYLG